MTQLWWGSEGGLASSFPRHLPLRISEMAVNCDETLATLVPSKGVILKSVIGILTGSLEMFPKNSTFWLHILDQGGYLQNT